jgi:membrane protease YdiL (CAAX protease family)
MLSNLSQTVKKKFLFLFAIDSPQKQRFLGLFAICSIAFGRSILSSIYALIYNSSSTQKDSNIYSFEESVFSQIHFIYSQLIILFVFFYIIHLQRRKLYEFGLLLEGKDILRSIKLFIYSIFSGYLFYIFLWFLCYFLIKENPKYLFKELFTSNGLENMKQIFGIGFLPLSLLMMVVNPFFEELLVRAYLMTEIEYLTGNINIAIVVSVLLQTSYHYYQGAVAPLFLSIGFMFFSFYYAKNRRITPVILAHMYFDLLALFNLKA